MSYASLIRQWFKNGFGGSLQLPDGWYGRPYDNQHQLTDLTEGADLLTIHLDDHLTLEFRNVGWAGLLQGDLVIDQFERLLFTARPYGDGEVTQSEYTQGAVRFCVAPG